MRLTGKYGVAHVSPRHIVAAYAPVTGGRFVETVTCRADNGCHPVDEESYRRVVEYLDSPDRELSVVIDSPQGERGVLA